MAAQSIYGTAEISAHTPLSEATIQTRGLARRHKGEISRPLDHSVINPLHDQYSNEACTALLVYYLKSSARIHVGLAHLVIDLIDACSGVK